MVINLGTGRGVTVRELVQAFEKVFGQEINKEECPPRPGDVAGAYANADRAKALLDWEARLSIEQGIADALQWAKVRDQVLGIERVYFRINGISIRRFFFTAALQRLRQPAAECPAGA